MEHEQSFEKNRSFQRSTLCIGTRHFRMHAVTRQHNPPSSNLISLPFLPNLNPIKPPQHNLHNPHNLNTQTKEIESLVESELGYETQLQQSGLPRLGLEQKEDGVERRGKDGVEVGSFGEGAGVCIGGRRGEEDT